MQSMTISEKAQAALLSFAPREGAGITGPGGQAVRADDEVLTELSRAGLVGPQYGLTRAGVIARKRVQEQMLGAAFGI